MPIIDRIIEAFTKTHAMLPDKPTIPSDEVKAWYDSSPEEVRVALNGLIQDLGKITDGDSGADNIGATAISGIEGNTVQVLLEALKNYTDTSITEAILGPVAVVTDDYLSDDPTQIKARVSQNTTLMADLTQFKAELQWLGGAW